MKFPQTTASELAENIKAIGDYGCLAMCYIYCAGIDPDNELEYINIVNRAIKRGILDKECTVLDANKLLEFVTGRKYIVTKKQLTEDFTINNLTEPTPVLYKYNGKGHFVVVQKGKIIFNSLMNSVCVAKGKAQEVRLIKKDW